MIHSFLSDAKKKTIDIYPIGIINLPTLLIINRKINISFT